MQHGMMLGSRTHGDAAVTPRCAKNCGVVALGSAAGENNFACLAANRLGDIIAGLVDRLASDPRKTMRARRVCVHTTHIRRHCRHCLLAHRCARSMV